MIDTDQHEYLERLDLAVKRCREAAAVARRIAAETEQLTQNIRELGGARIVDPDDGERRRPYLLLERGVPSPTTHIDALNRLRFALHGHASVWDAEADHYANQLAAELADAS